MFKFVVHSILPALYIKGTRCSHYGIFEKIVMLPFFNIHHSPKKQIYPLNNPI